MEPTNNCEKLIEVLKNTKQEIKMKTMWTFIPPEGGGGEGGESNIFFGGVENSHPQFFCGSRDLSHIFRSVTYFFRSLYSYFLGLTHLCAQFLLRSVDQKIIHLNFFVATYEFMH